MIRLYGLLFVLDLLLLVVALIDCVSADEGEVRHLPKIVWVLLILLFSPVGAIVWFVAGRPRRSGAARPGTWRPGAGFPEAQRPRRPVAPDDDPAFLAGLGDRGGDRDSGREDRELLSRWEADLKRREEELRRREGETS
ncbi:PLD nuclease N-terminal domain-containing protein [Spirilliplanes yamanashiensis]|uniref:Cardiolipin synthase N-terminal domain-containing protein n=1 Tax=Spirilliplanes yamanashiensis TaxID=42233 RepID=A0A8J3Y490_9ACTN|nr:PLD nuclease N-terminal domain-containing protein [Spirilliplanes yamanashiensis]MDP9820074.1 hypothetical protein [Spirilliplanes yamanashiensis]GIJ01105.1 hypothetical protein Sya03_04570 [Spirilliplanes yamanashiensis]